MCEEGTCVAVSGSWDYENVYESITTTTRVNSSGTDTRIREVLKHWTAGSDPTVSDDVDLGFAVGSRWYNTTGDEEFVLVDATDGAAVWKSTTEGSVAETFNVLVGAGNNAIVGAGNNVICTTCGS